MIGGKSFKDLFSGDIDDDDVAKMLSQAFPGIQITAPIHLAEKIRVAGRDFNVKSKDDMAKLITYLNTSKLQTSISAGPNTEFNTSK